MGLRVLRRNNGRPIWSALGSGDRAASNQLNSSPRMRTLLPSRFAGVLRAPDPTHHLPASL